MSLNLEKIQKWFEPPIFPGDEERNEQARILNVIELYLFGILALSAVAVPILTPSNERGLALGIILGLLIITGVSWLLLFNGRIEVSGTVMAISFWTVDITVAALAGGVSSPMMFSAVIIAILYGLLLKQLVGKFLIWMSAIAGLGMVILPGYGVILPQLFYFSETGVWFVLVVCMVFSGLTVNYALRRLEDALKQSRRKAEETVLKSESMFRAMFDNINDGMIYSDADGFISFRSPAYQRIDGFSNADWGKMNYFEQIHLEDQELMQRSWQAVLKNPVEPVRLEYRLRHKNATWVWVETVLQNLITDAEIGSIVLTTRDITERKRVEESLRQHDAEVLNSALEERQRLARELHDSVGQVLGYVSFQTDAARELYANGKADEADAQLVRLASIAQDAHADVREYILNLRTTPTTREPLFKTLQNYLDGFTRNYNIQTSLLFDEGFDENALDAKAQSNIFRIAQEALSNVRKHADARRVVISFKKEGENVHMIIEDDGRGFAAETLLNDGKPHFGLSFMNERVEQLGGSIRFESAYPSGTRILVEIPINKGETS